jgi:hypothetical protein
MNPLEQKNLKLEKIENERMALLHDIALSQERLKELYEQRQNIIMSQED